MPTKFVKFNFESQKLNDIDSRWQLFGNRMIPTCPHPLHSPNSGIVFAKVRDSFRIQICNKILVANLLKSWGVGKGDTVAIYMPMVPEAAYAMLACARIGAVHR